MSMSISLIAVFIPILLMSGLIGRLFHEFAMTISGAIAVSMVVSLTTTPMLCARLLKPHGAKHGLIYRASEKGFIHLNSGYKRSLAWVLRHQRLVFAIAVIAVFVNVYLYIIVPKGFFPQQDTGRMMGTIMADQDMAFAGMRERVAEFIRIVKSDPAIENVIAFSGGNTAQNQGRMFVTLKPLNQRKVSIDQVINRIRPKTSHVPGATLFFQAAQDLQIGGRFANAQYQYTLSGEDLAELYAVGAQADGQAAGDSDTQRCQQRPAGAGPAAERHHRSRYRRAPGNYALSKLTTCSTTLSDSARSRPSTRR